MTNLLFVLCAITAHADSAVPRPDGESTCEESILAGDVKGPLRAVHAAAVAKIEGIRKAALHVEKVERKFFGEVVKAAEAALGKHNDVFEAAKNLRLMDIPHHMEILRAIADFEPETPRASMVKIDEAVRLRHSRRDYIECEE